MFFLSDTMKFVIVFALAFARVSAKDVYSRSIEAPVLENEGRINNGLNALSGQFYYQVGLSLKRGAKVFWCGGSWIGETWVLSAAHCTYKVSSVKVYLGATQRLAPAKVDNVSESDIFTHPNWNRRYFKNDISLIQIPKTAQSLMIGIIRIPSNDDEYVGDSVVVSGWGLINDNTTKLSKNLQYVILKVSPGIICSKEFHSQFSDYTNICVATPNMVSPCQGDSDDWFWKMQIFKSVCFHTLMNLAVIRDFQLYSHVLALITSGLSLLLGFRIK